MFASRSLAAHLVRGGVGLGALAATALWAPHAAWLALPLLLLALVALRGCPMCWTIGLVQTWLARTRGKGAGPRCTDGSCAGSRHR
jgi:hypothetical protein